MADDPTLWATADARKQRILDAVHKSPDASKSGPFYEPDSTKISVHPELGPHFLSISDLFKKYMRPAQDTVPHTTGVTPDDKKALGSDVDVAPPSQDGGVGLGIDKT